MRLVDSVLVPGDGRITLRLSHAVLIGAAMQPALELLEELVTDDASLDADGTNGVHWIDCGEDSSPLILIEIHYEGTDNEEDVRALWSALQALRVDEAGLSEGSRRRCVEIRSRDEFRIQSINGDWESASLADLIGMLRSAIQDDPGNQNSVSVTRMNGGDSTVIVLHYTDGQNATIVGNIWNLLAARDVNTRREEPSLEQVFGRNRSTLPEGPGQFPRQVRPETPQFQIDWDNGEAWSTPQSTHPIVAMDDRYLWNTVIWIIRNSVALHGQYSGAANPYAAPALQAYNWLRDQIAFRALVRESIRRCLSFPPDVFRYLKDYVLDRAQTLDGYEPWRDPRDAGQATQLAPFLNESLIPPEIEHGKARRSINL